MRIHRLLMSQKAWVGFDQGLSSLSNALATILVARSTDASSLGVFAIAFTAYWLALGVCRAYVQDPVLLFARAADQPGNARETYLFRAAGGAVSIGVLSGLVFVVIGVVSPLLRPAFLPLGLLMPMLLLQDACRYAQFAVLKSGRSVISDATWITLMLITFPFVSTLGAGTLAWAGSGAVACFAFRPVMLLGGLRHAGRLRWFRDHSQSGGFLLLEFTSREAVSQVALWLIAAAVSLAAAGAYRTAQILLAPVRLATHALTIAMLPELAGGDARGLSVQARRYLLTSTGVAALCFIIVVLIPNAAGTAVFGPVWVEARPLALILVVASVPVAYIESRLLILKTLRAFRSSLVTRLALAPLATGLIYLGLHMGQAAGAAWGLAAGELFSASVWWYVTHRAIRSASWDVDSTGHHQQEAHG